MARDLLERLIGGSLLIDEGLDMATCCMLINLDVSHLELNPAIRIGVDDGRGKISGFEIVSNYAGPPYHGRLVLGEDLGQYFIHRTQAKRILPYDINKALSEHLSENERKRLKGYFW